MARNSQEEQDFAAGGQEYRKVKLPSGGEALASIEVHTFSKGIQQWGYLRFKLEGKNYRFYVGKVSAATRAESLATGWRLVRSKRVLERAGWQWVIRASAVAQKQSKKRVPDPPTR